MSSLSHESTEGNPRIQAGDVIQDGLGGGRVLGNRHGRPLDLASKWGQILEDQATRLHAIRRQIDAGTFETPERIAGTVERVLTVMLPEED